MSNLKSIKLPEKSENQKDFMESAIDMSGSTDELGEMLGFAMVAIYKEGVSCCYAVPESIPNHLLPSLTKDILRDFMKDDESDD